MIFEDKWTIIIILVDITPICNYIFMEIIIF